MRLIKIAASFAALAVMAVTSSVHAQNVVLSTNGDFEDSAAIGGVGDGTPDQWNPFEGGGATAIATTNPFDGVQHTSLVFSGAENGFAGYQYQIDGITPGASYTFSLNAASEGADLGGVNGEFRIEYLDAVGGFATGQFDNNVSLDSVTDTYAAFSQTNVAPANATSLRAVFATQSFGGGVDGTNSNTGTLFVDGATITGPAIVTVPEPSSIALLGLATCGLVARRRRS